MTNKLSDPNAAPDVQVNFKPFTIKKSNNTDSSF